MIIKQSQTTKFSTPDGEILDYPMPSEDIGISYQMLDGRGPQKGKYFNSVCHEIYFVIKGTATFYMKNKEYSVEEKDIIIVKPNTPYYINAQNFVFITITRPNWYPEQYQEIND